MPDVDVTKRTKRSLVAVKKRRLRLHIPDLYPKHRVWTEAEIKLLGTMSNTKLADKIGCKMHIVNFKRRSLNIPTYFGPKRSRLSWTAAQLRLLGTMPDEAVADRISRAVATVTCWRELLHISKFNPELRDWTPEEDKLLGTNTDKALAQKLGRTLNGVTHRRVRLKTPVWRP